MTQLPFPADEKVIRHMKSRLGFGAYLGANCHSPLLLDCEWTNSPETNVPYRFRMDGELKILSTQFTLLHNVWLPN